MWEKVASLYVSQGTLRKPLSDVTHLQAAECLCDFLNTFNEPTAYSLATGYLCQLHMCSR